MDAEIQKLFDAGIIEVSNSPWRAQAFVSRTGHKPGMVIDYSETINRYTELDAYPFADAEGILNEAAEDCVFSKIDLKSAYHQVPIRTEDRPLTAFEVNGRLWQFTRLAFGLTNAVPVFQRIMDDCIREAKVCKAKAFLDDVIVRGRDQEEHDNNVRDFMKMVKSKGMTLNLDKCKFNLRSVNILGHIIENGTKKPDPERLQPLLDFPTPKNVAELRRLLGLFAYNAKWVDKYSEKISPLTAAAERKQFPLGSECQEAIDTLKSDIAQSSLSVPLGDGTPLLLETDASDQAIGACLTQGERPIAFFSRTLSGAERKYSIVEKEAMAIVETFRKWSHYIRCYQTIVMTDQRSVAFLFSRQKSKIKNDKLIRWRLELSEYQYEITYRSGKHNVRADAMSRLCAVGTSHVEVLHESLAHPGINRFWDYIQRNRLAISLDEVRNCVASCDSCAHCKPRFFKPSSKGQVIRAPKPFERLGIDIVGPKIPSSKSGARFLFTVVDEYSRFPFGFALREITTAAIIDSLKQLFHLFGTPGFIHSDRGTQFSSMEFQDFCNQLGISHSRTTPYNPRGNGQTERFNGMIWKNVQCLLYSNRHQEDKWEDHLPRALAAIRALNCSATNETPHARFLAFDRRGSLGFCLPPWLRRGNQVLVRNFVRNKSEPLVCDAEIVDVINE